METTNTVPPASQHYVETVSKAQYEVVSNYVGEITFLDLLKQMLKRDLERDRPDED